MRGKAILSGLIAAMVAAPLAVPIAAQGAVQPAPEVMGHWINPYGSVVVETAPCGAHLCGRVSWASAEALQDAKESGITGLIGTELLRDYSPSGPGHWRGRVYVPDMGRTFYSTINVEGPDALRISGCILGGLICKSQLWHRQPQP